MNDDPYETLARKTRVENDGLLFDLPPDWRSLWWGMPEFNMGDARPQYKITINFMTLEDVISFGKKVGISTSSNTDTAWFPPQQIDQPKEWEYINE